MKTNSIRFKTSILYSGILSVILIGFSTYVYGTAHQILYRQLREDLQVKAGQIDAFLDAYASITPSNKEAAFYMNQYLSASDKDVSKKWIINQLWAQDSRSLGLGKDYFRILSPRGRVRLRSNNLNADIDKDFNSQFPAHPDEISFTHLYLNHTYFYGISYPFSFANRNAFVLQLATPTDFIQRILSQMVVFMIIGIVAILVTTIFMGSFLTRRILKPVSDATVTANSISQTNLHLRIPREKLDHEMEELVGSFNRMIERLEKSFEHINEFSSHVAHELKTPLAVIKGELELALAGGNSKDEDRRVMKVVLEEIDRLIRTTKDLLLLAKLEYKLNVFKMEKINIIEFLKDIYQHSKILADQRNIALSFSAPADEVSVLGDMVHLRRVFFNIIHNAVKFTAKQGIIEILAKVSQKQIWISIKDTGIGIADANQAKIFEKFYRIRRTDYEENSGSGLGLSMARAVARSHGGDIIFKSQLNKGSTFTVILPIITP